MNDSTQIFRLTEFSKGAGCGCKISPKGLKEILTGAETSPHGKLLVGNNHGDDAAAYDLGNGDALIASTDFFMPVVDDAEAFGKIAAANAISDIYAMGGKPIVALAIMGWPDKIPASEARRVMTGAREICEKAGIALAGGHSIESEEPIFGLSVNGIVAIENLKKNNAAEEGDYILLSKPLGLGILSTAQKRKIMEEEDVSFLTAEMTKLNSIGEQIGGVTEVTAMTDVTGFGLAGHLTEMAEGSNLTAVVKYSDIPIYQRAINYLKQRSIPDATYRNWQSYADKIELAKGIDIMEAFSLLPDPQTNGGLLISVRENGLSKVKEIFEKNGLRDYAKTIGRFELKQKKSIIVN